MENLFIWLFEAILLQLSLKEFLFGKICQKERKMYTAIMYYTTRKGGRYDHEPINIYSEAQIVSNFYCEPLGYYSEPVNLVSNPATAFFIFFIYQFTHSLNNFTKLC